jgi:hypothetical protein
MRGRTSCLAVVVAICSVGFPRSSSGEDKKPEPAPALLAKGPSLRETGRVGSASVEGGVGIQRRAVLNLPAENSVAKAVNTDEAQDQERRQSAAGGFIDPILLDQELQARLSQARTCRVDVARRKRVAPTLVVAKTLELRWIIQPSGIVAATQVVATTPTDPGVMSCVKLRMASWTFTRPLGGPLAMDRALVFR